MKGNYIHIAVLLLAAALAGSCGKKLVEESLTPSDLGTSAFVESDDNSLAAHCFDHQPGAAPETPGNPNSTIWVGYVRNYNPGTNPFPCWNWSCHIYRGAFRFDMTPYKDRDILTAVLHFGVGQAKYESGGTASNEGAWVKEVCLATNEWFNKPNPLVTSSFGELYACKPIPGMPELPHGLKPAESDKFPVKFKGTMYSIEVTNIVRDWIKGVGPNLGMVLKGVNEKVVGESNAKAMSPVSHIKLDISYFVPK
ncbi:MAG: hypothetical protein KJ002_06400 [Candidatus Dadabacteria bacterium]|nr:hypothetical protein [Candidatus Dadabacteria bacterium]